MRIITILLVLLSATAFGQIKLELPEIEGPIRQATNPDGWTTYVGSPDIIEGEGVWFDTQYTIEHVNGKTQGKSMVWMMFVRPGGPEGMQTELKGLKVGETYSVSIGWQQCAMMEGDERMYWGGELEMIVQDKSTIFTSEGIDDGWQIATVVFKAKSSTVTVAVSMHNPDYDPTSKWGGCIVVDNVCDNCPAAEVNRDFIEADGN